MADEGYLQLKIRELNDKIIKLEDEIKEIRIGYERKLEDREAIVNTVKKAIEELRFKDIKTDIRAEVEICFKTNFKEMCNQFNSLVKKELKVMNFYNNISIKKFCDEIVLSRRDLSLITNILRKKKIVTEEEIKFLEKKINEGIGELKEYIYNQFMMKLITVNKEDEIKKVLETAGAD